MSREIHLFQLLKDTFHEFCVTLWPLLLQRWCVQLRLSRWCRCSLSSLPSSSVTSDTSGLSAPYWPLCPAFSSSSQVGPITHVLLSPFLHSVIDYRCLMCSVSRMEPLHHSSIFSVWCRCSGCHQERWHSSCSFDFPLLWNKIDFTCTRLFKYKSENTTLHVEKKIIEQLDFLHKRSELLWTAGGCSAPISCAQSAE